MYSNKLTSVDEGIHVLNLPDGGVVAVGDQRLHRVQQAVHIDDGSKQTIHIILLNFSGPIRT